MISLLIFDKMLQSSDIFYYSIFNFLHQLFPSLDFFLRNFFLFLYWNAHLCIVYTIVLQNNVHSFFISFLLEHFFSFLLFFLSDLLPLLHQSFFSTLLSLNLLRRFLFFLYRFNLGNLLNWLYFRLLLFVFYMLLFLLFWKI